MPQAPNSEIPYNVPWEKQKSQPADLSASSAHRAGAAARPRGQSQEALLQRALEILENPSRLQGWLSDLVSRASGGYPLGRSARWRTIALAGSAIALLSLAITAAIITFDIYQGLSKSPSSSRISLGDQNQSSRVWDRIVTLNSSSKVELAWSYPSEHVHQIDGFLIYRCSFTVVDYYWEKFCRHEWEYTRIASVGRDQRSFIDHIPLGVGLCYLISAYNQVEESKRTAVGCYIRPSKDSFRDGS